MTAPDEIVDTPPIPDIAEDCGFKYVEHMIPVFKKYHGCTPSRYRKNARLGV